jgi:alpha-tubulin suppressor-like RCC1 family protein
MGTRRASTAVLFLAALAAAATGCREDSPTAPDDAHIAPPDLATAGAPLAFRQLSVGAGPVCGVTFDDRAWCWGANQFGGLGNGESEGASVEQCGVHACSTRPVAVLGGHRFRQVSAGFDFTCGTTTDDQAWCWGGNQSGQLGAGTADEFSTVPVPVAGGRRFSQVAAGSFHACGITTAREAFCWGANDRGQLGNGTVTQSAVPVRVARALEWIELSGGDVHTCGVTTGKRAYCWGGNLGGALGDGGVTSRPKPTKVVGGLLVEKVEAGWSHTCAVTTENRAYCWGTDLGAVGDGTTRIPHLTPTLVAGNRSYRDISAGWESSCGVTVFGRGFCWGEGRQGQVGDGAATLRIKPFPLAVDLHLASVSVGLADACGLTVHNLAYCWGYNLAGQIGDGTTTRRLAPVAVLGPI